MQRPWREEVATSRATLAKNVRRLRTAAKLTQGEAAERAGLTLRLYVKIETGEGNPTIETMTKLSNGFAVDPTELVAKRRQR